MPGNFLTVNSAIQCPHGGQATLTTTQIKVAAERGNILLETDIHVIAGCPFTVGQKYSPCVKIEWSAGTSKVSINGTPALVKSSIGKCSNAEGAPQGLAIINNTQLKASGQ